MHFMYLRLPSITSIKSSTVASSRNKTLWNHSEKRVNRNISRHLVKDIHDNDSREAIKLRYFKTNVIELI